MMNLAESPEEQRQILLGHEAPDVTVDVAGGGRNAVERFGIDRHFDQRRLRKTAAQVIGDLLADGPESGGEPQEIQPEPMEETILSGFLAPVRAQEDPAMFLDQNRRLGPIADFHGDESRLVRILSRDQAETVLLQTAKGRPDGFA